MIQYIGNDTALSLTPGYDFTISTAGSDYVYRSVYTGHTGANDSTIYPNRIAQRYLSGGTLDFSTGVTYHSGSSINVMVSQITPSSPVVRTYFFTDSWCGKYTKPALSNPINGKMDPRMLGFWTVATESEITFEIE